MANVPRVTDQSGSKSSQDEALRREYDAARRFHRAGNAKYAFGTSEATEAWKRRISRTRSF